ncbi:site-specific integrase [Mesonia sp. MT50]|uniref:Site-specific integrase n=4 Tax=Flavobacteriaceae TaxID=49546 RepID=A0A3E1QB98_9FLAO|nr:MULTISPECIES: site-specific integrase [Flavobacteriaceae]HAF77301.1 site-specific integrase [Maribacter sp.]MBA80297.1 integrase [Leeuwenhoekiella sp.]MDN3491331.1 site-specific integrase [Winogradskyella bathintestinalis]MDQ7917211.1 site-specific integrase [Mesonia profundi]RFN59419.1 site-specific integrase [Marixanthomonas ophiurae]|tara:strand:- start:1443 stop:2663 length:1221 start_codon:yes stop_codon:yes gene_type:complete
MRTSSTFSILFWVYGKRAVNNKANIYIRVTLNGKRVNISLKKKINISTWDEKLQRASGTDKDSRILNLYLNEVQSKVYRIYEDFKRDEVPFTSQMVKAKFLGEDKTRFSFQNLVDYYNEKMQHKLHRNTMGQYKTSQRYMMEYILKEYKLTDIPLFNLEYGFIVGFEDFLRSYVPKSGQSKIGNNTAMKHIKRLRRMVTLAYRMKWIERDPFVNFKMKIEKKERGFLTDFELLSIEDLSSSIERLMVVKDLFVFSCYTGISYVDIVQLNEDNIVMGIDGSPWIMAERVKTGAPFKIPLLPKAAILIDKYKDHYRTNDTSNLLPKLSNQKLNSYLKEIADLCGIKKNLTFHMARHTFATTVTLSNGVPIETVSKLLGHTKLSTTQIYARVVERKVSDDMALLKSKIG